jgi:hypothetical protein
MPCAGKAQQTVGTARRLVYRLDDPKMVRPRDVGHPELRQRYRAGQEDQLGALGLVLNAVFWNTRYMTLS